MTACSRSTVSWSAFSRRRNSVRVMANPDDTTILGEDFIMYASDYPHWDGDWPESTKPLRERADLDEATRAKIAGVNARRFYRLNA